MRKAQKEQMEEFLGLLKQIHEQVGEMIGRKNISAAIELLVDCQEGAVNLGTLIEKSEGEGLAVISMLEEYCELAYQVHEKLSSEQPVNASAAYKSMCSTLFKIEYSVKNDIKVRIEAVFLPYKASMWDSLESVWKAADDDPDCDAYVIPIPYYDRKPDGSFGEVHYEGNEYPENVPVMWYEDYDFAARKPDIIFIHNPYDEYNYMTSVHPFFYSENLKQFTDKLVYIPYFLLDEIDPDDEELVGDIEHLCAVSVVMYADYVIVQSEAMRQIYINSIVKILGEKDIPRSHWEKIILGLGSPKVDKVLTTEKEKPEIPEEWLRIVRKPDGATKRIILYNTSVAALLYYEDKLLEKMKTVFQIFKENQDEVALLWRPHPLMHAAIESMRPQLREEYNRIEEQYKKEGWGIYDDTADMYRAIAVSDAYYGDMSSLVHLYQKTGKHIMIQNVEMSGEKE